MRIQYRHKSTLGVCSYKEQTEHPIYGASRLGVYKKGQNVQYELTDHLGNVRTVVDKTDPTPSIFADYYPGGMQMPNRNSLNGSYRYAYQGQEKDPETGKEAFQLRLYDSRINRWLTTDPAGQYSSPYVAMGNNWISQIDPDGAWHRDADGHLISDTGDTAASLATFLNTTRGHANEIISNEGFFGNVMTTSGGLAGEQQAYLSDYNLTGSNTLSRSNNFHFASILNENRVDVPNHPLTQAMAAVLAAPLVIEVGIAYSANTLSSKFGYEVASEFISNGGDLGKMNLASIAASTFSNKYVGDIVGSAVSVSIYRGFEINPFDETLVNLAVGKVNGSIHTGLSKASKLANNGSVEAMSAILTVGGQSLTKMISNEIKQN